MRRAMGWKAALRGAARAAAAAGAALGPLSQVAAEEPPAARFSLLEATLPQLQRALDAKQVSSEQLVERYLARIAAYDDAGPQLNAYLSLNPGAREQARALDARRASESARGPLFGIPVLLKDNIDTAEQPNTAGSLALAGSRPPDDATIAAKLRAAGAIVLGKASLSEFANFLTQGLPNGYSSLGGYGRNPYDPRALPGGDGRSVLDTGGSSSGSAIGVSANLAAVAVGTETSGSILSPASASGVVGIKPTVGLVSRDGIIPITPEQDTAGPIARTVTDAAILLGVLAGIDPADPATVACAQPGRCFSDYAQFLERGALRGARIAVPPFPDNRAPIMSAAIQALREQGALVQEIPALATQARHCLTVPLAADCSSVLLFDFKRSLDAYLAATPRAPRRSLAEVIAFNVNSETAPRYGQSIALAAQQLDTTAGSADEQRFRADRAADLQKSRSALDAIYRGANGAPGFDAILFSENFGAGITAKAGYPSITVPGGYLPPSAPVSGPVPSGVTFSGPAWSEPRLIALAFAFEQATLNRRPPQSAPALPDDVLDEPAPNPGGAAGR